VANSVISSLSICTIAAKFIQWGNLEIPGQAKNVYMASWQDERNLLFLSSLFVRSVP
jgi:hypothetical protein